MDSPSHPRPLAPFAAARRRAAARLPIASALLGLLASGCVAYAPGPRPLPPPPAPMARDEAVQRAFDYAAQSGYGRLSLRTVRLEGDLWEVLLRVKDPFKGRVLVSVDAYDGRVIKADAWHKQRRQGHDEEGDDEGEGEHGNGRGHGRGHDRDHEED